MVCLQFELSPKEVLMEPLYSKNYCKSLTENTSSLQETEIETQML